MRSELIEHDENGGDTAQVVVFVPTASKATAQGFTNHIDAPDANLTFGTGVNQYTGSFAATAPGTPSATTPKLRYICVSGRSSPLTTPLL